MSRKQWIIFILLAMLYIRIVAWYTPYDDTDDALNGERSGMRLLTDHNTGCQHLGTGAYVGSITPRMSGNDKRHMGCKDYWREMP